MESWINLVSFKLKYNYTGIWYLLVIINLFRSFKKVMLKTSSYYILRSNFIIERDTDNIRYLRSIQIDFFSVTLDTDCTF